MTRVAAIDCGTNSIRLLVADVDPDAGTLVDLDRRMEVVRLGQGVDRTGRLAPEALARTLDAARRYNDDLHGARGRGDPVRRDVGDARRREPRGLRRRRARRAGRRARGRRRARRRPSSRSAAPPACSARRTRARSSWSTSVAARPSWCWARRPPEAAFSMDVGCVRMTERHLHSDPPTAAEIAAAHADVARRARHGVGRRPARQDRHARRPRRHRHHRDRARAAACPRTTPT